MQLSVDFYCVQQAQSSCTTYPQEIEITESDTYGLRGEGLLWLIGAVVCLLAANRGSNCSLTPAMDVKIVKCFWSRVWLI